MPQEAPGHAAHAPEVQEAGGGDDSEENGPADVPGRLVGRSGAVGRDHAADEGETERRRQALMDEQLDLSPRVRPLRIERDGSAESAQRRFPLPRLFVQQGDPEVGVRGLRIDLERALVRLAGLVMAPVHLVDGAAGDVRERVLRGELAGAFGRGHRGGGIGVDQGFGEPHVVHRGVRLQPHRRFRRLDGLRASAGVVEREGEGPETVVGLRIGCHGRARGRDRRVVLAQRDQEQRTQIQRPRVSRLFREHAVEYVQALSRTAELAQFGRAFQVLVSPVRHSSRYFLVGAPDFRPRRATLELSTFARKRRNRTAQTLNASPVSGISVVCVATMKYTT